MNTPKPSGPRCAMRVAQARERRLVDGAGGASRGSRCRRCHTCRQTCTEGRDRSGSAFQRAELEPCREEARQERLPGAPRPRALDVRCAEQDTAARRCRRCRRSRPRTPRRSSPRPPRATLRGTAPEHRCRGTAGRRPPRSCSHSARGAARARAPRPGTQQRDGRLPAGSRWSCRSRLGASAASRSLRSPGRAHDELSVAQREQLERARQSDREPGRSICASDPPLDCTSSSGAACQCAVHSCAAAASSASSTTK